MNIKKEIEALFRKGLDKIKLGEEAIKLLHDILDEIYKEKRERSRSEMESVSWTYNRDPDDETTVTMQPGVPSVPKYLPERENKYLGHPMTV